MTPESPNVGGQDLENLIHGYGLQNLKSVFMDLIVDAQIWIENEQRESNSAIISSSGNYRKLLVDSVLKKIEGDRWLVLMCANGKNRVAIKELIDQEKSMFTWDDRFEGGVTPNEVEIPMSVQLVDVLTAVLGEPTS